MPSHDHQAGFTVLEALVALAILTGVTASILLLLSTARSSQLHSRSRLKSALQAETLLNRIGRDIPLKSGSWTGQFADGHQWSIAIRPFVDDASPEKPRPHPLYDVQIRVGASLDANRDAELRTITRGAL